MADSDTEEVVFTPTTAQLDLERRLDPDYEGVQRPRVLNPGYGEVELGNLYVGTNMEYQNHANDTEAPYQAEEGPDQLAEEKAFAAFDSWDVKDQAVDLDDNETLPPGEGVSPNPAPTAAVGQGSPLVVESPPSGEVPETGDEALDENGPAANYTGGTGQGVPTDVKEPDNSSDTSASDTSEQDTAPTTPSTPSTPTPPSS